MLELTGIISYITARTVSSIYIAKHYPEMELNFDYTDASKNPVFENTYSVIYKDKDENTQGFVMYPKQFPMYVLFDPITGQC